MANKEKKWYGVTRSPEEDLALVDIIMSSRALGVKRFASVMFMSLVILSVYLGLNFAFWPTYPVVTPFAENSAVFVENYPPFRMYEWANYSVTREILDGRAFEENTFSRLHSPGYPLIASPLVGKWGERGMYFTNAFIMWAAALVFFLLMVEVVEYPLAMAMTFILAFATPNIFYAASAFPEPASQLFTLIAVLLFIKGLMAHRDWLFYGGSGFAAGLNLFVAPLYAVSIVVFAGLLINERGKFSYRDRSLMSLLAGFLVPLAVFFAANKLFFGEYGIFLFSKPPCAFDPTTLTVSGEEGNFFTGIWKLLFDSPNGIVFLMPVATLVPMGIIVMWRNELHSLTVIVGALLLYAIFTTAMGRCPVTGEGIGSRQLVPLLPFFVLPLSFLWREQAGEKIWLSAALVLTVYMSTFGWWTGTVKGKGFFISALHDRSARAVILARKGLIGRPNFMTASELSGLYMESLAKRDMHQWLQCLDGDVLNEIEGFERIVFSELTKNLTAENADHARYIESVDPNTGVRPVLPAFGGFPMNDE